MAQNAKKRVGVIFGGASVEHEVSVITGIQALLALRDTPYEPIPIYVDKSGKWFTGSVLCEIDRYRDPKELTRSATPVSPASEPAGRLVLVGTKNGLFSRPSRLSVDVLLLAMHG
ncbi:MAG TPA: hypothetical protein VMO47_18890 [Rhodothermales bacterium]|nr:hypothetical protein [Rhodothermales bacterium]